MVRVRVLKPIVVTLRRGPIRHVEPALEPRTYEAPDFAQDESGLIEMLGCDRIELEPREDGQPREYDLPAQLVNHHFLRKGAKSGFITVVPDGSPVAKLEADAAEATAMATEAAAKAEAAKREEAAAAAVAAPVVPGPAAPPAEGSSRPAPAPAQQRKP
jgi:hypothetical protein